MIKILLVLLFLFGCSYSSCGDLNMRLPGCAYDEAYIESLGHE